MLQLLGQILLTHLSPVIGVISTGLIVWYFKKLKTSKESLEDDVDLKLKLLNDLVNSLSVEINRCRIEIKDLKTELDSSKKTLLMAYNCPHSSDCKIIKRLQEK